MNTPNFENLTIPAEILFNKDLSDREKILLSIFLSLSRKSNFCYAGNKYISDIFNVTNETISRVFSSLKDKKYIKMNYNNKTTNSRKREIIPIKENIFKHSKNEQEGIVKNDKYINNNINNNNIKDIPNRYKTDQYDNIDLSQYYANKRVLFMKEE